MSRHRCSDPPLKTDCELPLRSPLLSACTSRRMALLRPRAPPFAGLPRRPSSLGAFAAGCHDSPRPHLKPPPCIEMVQTLPRLCSEPPRCLRIHTRVPLPSLSASELTPSEPPRPLRHSPRPCLPLLGRRPLSSAVSCHASMALSSLRLYLAALRLSTVDLPGPSKPPLVQPAASNLVNRHGLRLRRVTFDSGATPREGEARGAVSSRRLC